MPPALISKDHITYARSTRPDLRHVVHTCILLAPPFTLHLTF